MPNDERRTPPELFAKLDAQFHFTIDVAASAENAKVAVYWTKTDNALEQDWTGHVAWCNPPYSRGNLLPFNRKAYSENAQTLLLMPSDNSTEAGQFALKHAAAILFLNKRYTFGGCDPNEKSGAKFANWLVLYDSNFWRVLLPNRRRNVATLHLLDMGVVL